MMSVKSLFDEGLAQLTIVSKDKRHYRFRIRLASNKIPQLKFGYSPEDSNDFMIGYADGTGQTKIRLKKAYLDEPSQKFFSTRDDNEGEEWKE